MEALGDFVSWAWERHHNPLSWWIRPLFLIPFAFFAYWRSWLGIAVTLVALATSMFWFPRPARVDPQVAEFLAAERRAVLGEWTLPKVVMLASIPAFFLGVGAAFWRRALWLAVLLIGLGALMKVIWSSPSATTPRARSCRRRLGHRTTAPQIDLVRGGPTTYPPPPWPTS